MDRLRAERDRFVGFAFAGGDLLLEVDDAAVIRFAAGAARSFTGHDCAGLLGRPLPDLVAGAHRAVVGRAVADLTATGRLGPLLVNLSERLWTGGPVVLTGHRLSGATDRSQLALTAAPAAHLLLDGRDPGTGLLDRLGFGRRLAERMTGGGGREDERLTLFDLEGFGSLAGRLDEGGLAALQAEIGTVLCRHAVDGEGAGALEDGRFGLVHEPTVDLDGLERNLTELSRRADPTGFGFSVRMATIELAIDGMSDDDVGRALRYVINRFIHAAGEGFSIGSLHDGLNSLLNETVVQVSDYRSRLEGGTVRLAFQPIVDLAQRRVHHYEALVRFEEGCSPLPMVTFAEEFGVVTELDLLVCRRVIDLLAEPGATGTRIAVNVSGRSLQSALFVGALTRILDDHPGVRGRLLLELTESAEVDRLEPVAGAIRDLRRRGFPVCLDDFGAGAAAFHYLRMLEADFVKIDGSYVQATGERERAILRGIVGLSRELGIATIAEMVEHEWQARGLAALRVDFGQGYLFGRPLPAVTCRGGAPAPRQRTRVLKAGGVMETVEE